MTTPASLPPTPIDWRNLIQAGRDLLNPQQTGFAATDEHVHRAISNSSALIGSHGDALTAAAWTRIFRSRIARI